MDLDSLPISLTQSSHILLDTGAASNIKEQPPTLTSGADNFYEKISVIDHEITNPIPIKQTKSKELYLLQKSYNKCLLNAE